jgi:DNA end-binding protein Ku
MPVRLFSGARGERISFNTLHRTDHVRVKQQYICPEEEVVVDRDEIVKGYEFRKGEYVIIEPDEIKKIEPKTAKAMEILEFVKLDEVDPIYFETSYYMVPEEAGRRPYALLSQALEDSKYMAIAKLTMHNREYTVMLRPHKGGMLLHTMYYANEVRELDEFGRPDVEIKEAELKVAHQLIKAKLEGKEVTPVSKPKMAPVTDLMAALKQSLASMEGKKKAPQRVEAAEEASRVEAVPAKKKRGTKKIA